MIRVQVKSDLHSQPLTLENLFSTFLDLCLDRTKVLLEEPIEFQQIAMRIFFMKNLDCEKNDFESQKGCECRSSLTCHWPVITWVTWSNRTLLDPWLKRSDHNCFHNSSIMSTGKYKIIGFVTAKCAVHYDRKSRLNWSHAEPRLQNQLTCPDKNSFTNIKSRLNSCVFFFECNSCMTYK